MALPAGTTCDVHELEGVEGGTLRISLTYESAVGVGKTTGRTDTYRGRFTELVDGELVVEVDVFETGDPELAGDWPRSPEDDETAWRHALDRLVHLVEGTR